MKNKLTLLCISVFLIISCNDSLDVESLDIVQPNISQQNPALYEQYLKDLKKFKDSDHKVTYVWFDNSEKKPFSRAHHIIDLPDSIDVVSLMHPDNLADWEMTEIESLRTMKNTKVIFTMDFDKIKDTFDARIAALKEKEYENEEDRPKLPEFIPFLVDSVSHTLSLVDKYNYDGISLAYKGKSTLHMTDIEKSTYKTYEKAFIGIAEDWHQRNKNKMIVYIGYPQNLLNKNILASCRHIILPLTYADSKLKLNYELETAKDESIPLNRFVIAASTTSLDLADRKTGYWLNGTRALQGTADWVSSPHSDIELAGIAIFNVNNDYFNSGMNYMFTRKAMNTINPSIIK